MYVVFICVRVQYCTLPNEKVVTEQLTQQKQTVQITGLKVFKSVNDSLLQKLLFINLYLVNKNISFPTRQIIRQNSKVK